MSEPSNRATGGRGGLVGRPPTAGLGPPAESIPSPVSRAAADESVSAVTAGWLDGGWAALDGDGKILSVNEALAGWLERLESELLGVDFWARLAERCPGQGEALGELRDGSGTFRERSFRWFATGDAAEAGVLRVEVAARPGACVVRLESILPEGPELEEHASSDFPPRCSVQRNLWTRLTQAEAQLKLLSEQWPGVIFSQRADFSFRFISPRVEELTGIPAYDWGRRPELFWQTVHESDAVELRDQLARARSRREPFASTYRLRHARTGRILYVLEHRRPMLSPGGLVLGYEGVWLDVTRQTLTERRLSSATWKETLSALTMGLAHDFSNVMAGIHALVESCLEQPGVNPAMAEDLQLVKGSSREANQLVHQIIDLHQSRTGERYHHDLNELAAHLEGLARKIIPRRMRFSFERSSSPLPVHVDAVELRQVVAGLVMNAVDAMRPDGRLVLRTEAFSDRPPPGRRMGAVSRWPAVGLTVRDDGAGVAPENLARLGEPFFSTKPGGAASGLGLYNTRVFVERHGGELIVESTPASGSAFSLLFPEADFSETALTPDRKKKEAPAL